MRTSRPLALIVAGCLTVPVLAAVPASAATSTTWTDTRSTPNVVRGGGTVEAPHRPAVVDNGSWPTIFDAEGRPYYFDRAADAWQVRSAGPGGTARRAAARVDDRILVTSEDGAAWLWAASTDTWTDIGAPAAGVTPLWAFRLTGGSVLVGGGGGLSQLWHPETGWSDTTIAMQAAHGTGSAVTQVDGNTVLVAGGTGAPGTAEVFHEGLLSWTTVTGFRPRAGAVAVTLADGRALAVGGRDGGAPLATTDVFDKAAGAFTAGPDLAVPRDEGMASPLSDGTVLVVGGHDGGPNAAEVLDVAAGATTPAGTLSYARRAGVLVGYGDGTAFAVGGASTAVTERYHPFLTEAPEFFQPDPGATVAGTTTLNVVTPGPRTEFLVDGEPVGSSPGFGSASMLFDTHGWAPGAHTAAARACNPAGCGPLSDPLAFTVANSAPVLTAPAGVVRGVTKLAASAGGSVRFSIDGVVLGYDDVAPFELELHPFDLPSGPHTVTLRGCDTAHRCEGAESSTELVTDLVPAVTAPAQDAVLAGEVTLTAASEAPQVAFFVNGTQVGGPVPTSGGFASTTWPTYGWANSAEHQVTARGCDPWNTGPGNGRCAEASPPRTVAVDNATPVVTAPAPGAALSVPTTVTATAPGGRVVFFLDGEQIGTDDEAPYAVTLNPANVPGGAHELVARSCRGTSQSLCDGPASLPVPLTTSPRPEIEAPVEGEVSGVVPLRAASPAGAVRFFVDGEPLGPPVPTSGGVAVSSWPTYGWSNGPHQVSAVACDPDCATELRTVPVVVANAAPAVTAPAPGSVVGDAVTITATAPGGGVQFLVDGVPVGFDGIAPYAFRWSTAGTSVGGHLVGVRSCDPAGTRCAGPASGSRGIAVAELYPQIVAVSPRAISPDGDRVQDALTVTYTLDTTSGVAFRVVDLAGRQIYARGLGTLGPGRRTLVWNGTTSTGARAPSGFYTLRVETSKPMSGGTLRGLATAPNVLVDVARPPVGSFAGSGTFHPVPDGYADVFTPSFTLAEQASVALRVYDAAGRPVFTGGGVRSPGRVAVSWNGRLPSGALAPAGGYRYQWTARDAAGNTATSPSYPFGLSHKRLAARLRSQVVTPVSTLTDLFEGECADAVSPPEEHPDWVGGAGYYSLCAYDGFSSADFVASWHEFTLPPAIRYGNVAVSAVGTSPYGDSGALAWAYPNGPEITMGPAYGRYSLPSVPQANMPYRKVRWAVGAWDLSWYLVRSFTVTWVAYELV